METHLLLTAWNFDPILLLGLILLLGAYIAAIGPLRRRYGWGDPVVASRQWAFYCGWVVLALTMLSPLDTLGRRYSFTFHTAQLFIIITLAAPLLLTGLPDWLVDRILLRDSIRRGSRSLLFAVIAVVGFNAIILLWHAGPLYEAALASTPLHDLQLVCFLVAGVLTWWPLLTPASRQTRMSNPVQMIYLTMESLPLDIFGVAAIFAPSAFYTTYVHAYHLWGMSPMVDQQIAGGILAVPGNILDVVLMSVIFFAWIERIEKAQRAREAVQYEAEDVAAAAAIDSEARQS